jgi:deoxyadenosine/deoxycytidine kinase
MSFLADRYQQLSDDLAQFDLGLLVADYHIFKSLIFAKITLAEDEYRLYRSLFDIIYKEMPKLGVCLPLSKFRAITTKHQRGVVVMKEISASLDKINSG